MAATAKYLFDRNFEQSASTAEPPEEIVARQLRDEYEAKIERVREEEYQRGREDGARQTLQSIEARTDEAAGKLVATAGTILDRIEEECRAVRTEAIAVALAAAEKLAGELVRREPTALLEDLFGQCLEHVGEAPHVAIRVDSAIAERLQEKVNAIAAERGFTGRIMVLGDPETPEGDCRIEWADGGISRDFDGLRQHITKIVKHHLAANAGAGTPPDGDDAGSASMAAVATTDPSAAERATTNGSGESP